MNNVTLPWGIDSIRLRLPASLVVIEGLSRGQHECISQDYGSFVVARDEASQTADAVCRAECMAQPVGLPIEHFTVDGQYTLHKRRSGEAIEITGNNFVGHFVRWPAPIQAALSVAKEEEFASSLVLENFLRVLIAYRVLAMGGILLHSAGVVFQDRAYLFCGRSNAGKTTLARKASAAGARVLSDDINLVIPEQGVFRVHKVPFTGEFGRRAENLSGRGSFPLGGLVLLEKTPTLTASPVRSAEGVAGLLTGCPFVSDDPEEFPALLDVLTRLVAHKPIIRLGVGRDDHLEAVMETLLRYCKHD